MTGSERRRYFRIDDELGLTLAVIEPESGLVGEGAADDHRHLLQDQLQAGLEVQLRQALLDIRSKYADLAHVLDILNQKINLVYNNEVADQHTPLMKSVSLSACGIAVPWPIPLKIGTNVLLHLFLPPLHHLVKTEAQVVGVDKNADENESDPYILRMDFVSMSDAYQEVLIQHVVQRQSLHLRKRSGLDVSEDREDPNMDEDV